MRLRQLLSFWCFFDHLRASLAQIKSNLLTLLTLNLFGADESSENTLIPIISLQIHRSKINRKKIFAHHVELLLAKRGEEYRDF